MADRQTLDPELTWTGTRFERGVRVVIEGGKIAKVQKASGRGGRKLEGRALLPGMVNAHSHAFQRGLRGRGERFPKTRGSFWTWREAMYELVGEMDADRIYELSHRAFSEMLAAGITTVGEFHYLHHDATSAGFAFDEVVLRAAADAGIRIALLNAYYATGGIGQPLAGSQERFRTASLQEYWSQMDRLTAAADPGTQSIGVVAHSIRAVGLEDLEKLKAEADRRDLVFHMHVEEQPAEVKACEAAYGARPMALITKHLVVNDRFCAVHCTHTDAGDMDAFLDNGGSVCICPLTEANLGDGIAALPDVLAVKGRVCLGSDSNARISFTEEMRWLEYVQRLATGSRGVFVDAAGHCARALWQTATVHGSRALGVNAGQIKAGAAADLLVLDLGTAPLAGWTDDRLLESFIFGAGDAAIAATCVAGHWVAGESAMKRYDTL